MITCVFLDFEPKVSCHLVQPGLKDSQVTTQINY